jgi:cytochrome c biogenesis protein ResB
MNQLVEVNRPMRVAGLTFYQMAYEQEFDVVVWADGEEVERVPAQAYAPFTLESVGGMFFPGTLRVGTLYEKYHDTRPVVPHTALKWQPPAVVETDTLAAAAGDTVEAEPAPAPERIELGDLSAEIPLEVEDVTLTLENPYEGSVLSYRHDPGVALLYLAIIAFMVGLAIRSYWPSYRVTLWLEESAGAVTGRLAFRATGMLGEPEEIEERLAEELAG